MSKQQESSLPPPYEEENRVRQAPPQQGKHTRKPLQRFGDKMHTGGCLLLQTRNVNVIFYTIGTSVMDAGEKIGKLFSSSSKNH